MTIRVSAVVVTRNRPAQVKICLQSLVEQEHTLDEIAVIDDSHDDATLKVVESLNCSRVVYHRNKEGDALTIARNVGVKRTSGDIVGFFDDDVRLAPDYFSEVLAFLEDNPEAVGVQGFWGAGKQNLGIRLRGAVKSLLQIAHGEDDRCRVLSAWKNTYPSYVDRPMICQWLSGCNMVYRRTVFDSQSFDEKLLRGSYGEDIDFSYRLWKTNPRGLYLVPSARLFHDMADGGRAPDETFYKLAYTNTLYLRHKNLRRSLRTTVASGTNFFGELLLHAIRLARNPFRPDWSTFGNWAKGRWFAFRHREQIRKGDLSFLEPLLGY